MCEEVLAVEAPYRDALDDVALGARSRELPLADFIEPMLELLALHGAAGRYEEAIQAHKGHRRFGTRTVLVTSPAAFYAPLAPRPVGDVCAVVLLHVGCAGQSGVAGLVDGLDVVLALNL